MGDEDSDDGKRPDDKTIGAADDDENADRIVVTSDWSAESMRASEYRNVKAHN